jgi:hypothetical protein
MAGWGDAGKGAATGAALGTSVAPGIGTAIGAAAGGLLSGLTGGSSSEEKQWDMKEEQRYQNCMNLQKAANNYFAGRATEGRQKTHIETPNCMPPRPYPGPASAAAAGAGGPSSGSGGFSAFLDSVAAGGGVQALKDAFHPPKK